MNAQVKLSEQTAVEDFWASAYQVVDITSTYAGAYASRQLAEAGLPVLRVELSDSPALQQLPPAKSADYSVPYLSANGKKQCIRIDATVAAGKTLLESIISNSSVFVTDRPELFSARGARVTCQIHADNFCVAGDLPSSDVLVQAASGALSMTGHLGGPPALIGIPIGDVAPGLFAAIGIIRELLDDEPQCISVHSLDATLSLLSYLGCNYLLSGIQPPFIGSGHPWIVPYGAYLAKDGYIIVAPAFTQAFWRNLCRMLECPELIDDPRFVGPADRNKNREALQEILRPLFATRPVAEWEAKLDYADVPSGPFRSFRQALEYSMASARGMVSKVQGELFLDTPLVSNTPIDGGKSTSFRSRPWRQALTHLGLTNSNIEDLERSGVLRPYFTPAS